MSDAFASETPVAKPDSEVSYAPPPPPKPKPKPAPATTPKPKPKVAPQPAPPPKSKAPSPPTPPPPAPIRVDLELVMLVDVSDSVDDEEYLLQRLGYIEAFRDAELHALIASRNGVAVNMIQWSGKYQHAGSGWFLLYDAEDCLAFADRLARFDRRYRGGTNMGDALRVGRDAMFNNKKNGAKILGERKLIDVSGDGVCENYYFHATGEGTYADGTPLPQNFFGHSWERRRGELVKNEVIVNAISIGNTEGLKEWYATEVPMGDYSFAMHADTFEAFGEAIKLKLLRELATPIPATEIGTAYD
ncbi:MAG: DUF1194 domain-containing protein [Planctomycetota bacterium]